MNDITIKPGDMSADQWWHFQKLVSEAGISLEKVLADPTMTSFFKEITKANMYYVHEETVTERQLKKRQQEIAQAEAYKQKLLEEWMHENRHREGVRKITGAKVVRCECGSTSITLNDSLAVFNCNDCGFEWTFTDQEEYGNS